jgi:hypothetical protein
VLRQFAGPQIKAGKMNPCTQTQEAIYAELTARPKLGGKYQESEKFGTLCTVGVLDGPQVIVPQGQGA